MGKNISVWLDDDLLAMITAFRRANPNTSYGDWLHAAVAQGRQASRLAQENAELKSRLKSATAARPAQPSPRPVQPTRRPESEARREWNIFTILDEMIEALKIIRAKKGGVWSETDLAEIAAANLEYKINEWWDEIREDIHKEAHELFKDKEWREQQQ